VAPGLIEFEWVSNPVHDMVADAVLSVTLQVSFDVLGPF
jgi:hypothetical protein